MIDDDELEHTLRTLGSQQVTAPPLEAVLRRGRRHARRRHGMQAVLGVCSLLGVVVVAFAAYRDKGSSVVATVPQPSRVVEEVAASRPFGQNRYLLPLAVGPNGDLWAAWVGQGIYQFDSQMRVTRAIEGLDSDVLGPGGGIAVADDGTIVVAGTSHSQARDGHGEPLAVPTLRAIATDGNVATIAVLPGEGATSLPPKIADGRAFVALGDRLFAVRLSNGEIEASVTLGGGIQDLAVLRHEVWVATGNAVYNLSADGLVEQRVARRSAVEVAVTAGVAWLLDDNGGPAHRLDGQADTARGAWGTPLDLEPGDRFLWAYGQAAVAAFDSESGAMLAWRPLDHVYGAFATSGTTAWIQDDLADGIIRRYELRASVTRRATPTSTSEAPAEVAALVERLGCEREGQEQLALEPDEPMPSEAVLCRSGEASLSLRTYTSAAEVDAALRAVDAYCGFRTVGSRWMVVVDTPESAVAVQSKLGGRVVELSGC